MATRILILLLALSGFSGPAFGDEIPDAALAWAALFDPTPPQYREIQMQFVDEASVAPGCAVDEGCESLAINGWSLVIQLEPQDRRRFSPAMIRIHPLHELSPDIWIERITELAGSQPRMSVAAFAAGPYWVELSIPCTVGTLLPYEAQDLIDLIGTEQPQLHIPDTIGWSPCSQHRFEQRSREWLRSEALVEREQWGILLPRGRVPLDMPD